MAHRLEYESPADSGTWLDLIPDTIDAEGISWEGGINGNGPLDIVASVGRMSFALNNSASNSGGLQGYYSPGNANVRSGFTHGVVVRLGIDAPATGGGPGNFRWVFKGRIKTIVPVPGRFGRQITTVECTDWMAEVLAIDDLRLELILGGTFDDGMRALIAEVERVPMTQFGAGDNILPVIFSDDAGRGESALTILTKLAVNEGGRIFVTGTPDIDELLVAQRLLSRSGTASVATVTEDEVADFEAPNLLDRIINEVQSDYFPRVFSDDLQVIASLQAATEIPPGTTRTFTGLDYKNDTNAFSISAQDVVFEHGTDWRVYTLGVEQPESVATITTRFFGSAADITVENTSDGILTFTGPTGGDSAPQVRGRPIFSYAPVQDVRRDEASIAKHGRRGLSAPIKYGYNTEAANIAFIANNILDTYADIANVPTEVVIHTERPDLLEKYLQVQIGDRLTMSETVTGFSGDVFVQKVKGTLKSNVVSLSFELAPGGMDIAEMGFFTLGSPTLGRLDQDRLGLGL